MRWEPDSWRKMREEVRKKSNLAAERKRSAEGPSVKKFGARLPQLRKSLINLLTYCVPCLVPRQRNGREYSVIDRIFRQGVHSGDWPIRPTWLFLTCKTKEQKRYRTLYVDHSQSLLCSYIHTLYVRIS